MQIAGGFSPESRQRARGERTRLLLALAAALAAGPFLFGSLAAARESIEPYVDSLRTLWAVVADLLLVPAAGLLAVAALALQPLDRWQRMVKRLRGGPYALAALLVALPLVKTATNSVSRSSSASAVPAPVSCLSAPWDSALACWLCSPDESRSSWPPRASSRPRCW